MGRTWSIGDRIQMAREADLNRKEKRFGRIEKFRRRGSQVGVRLDSGQFRWVSVLKIVKA